MRLAYVLGGAACVWQDLKRLRAMRYEPDIYTLINDLGVIWPHRIDIWVSHHAEKLTDWVAERRKGALPPAMQLWTGPVKHRRALPNIQQHQQRGGSSGLLATVITMEQVDRLVLVGIPMTETPHWHNHHHKRPWGECNHYRQAWPHIKEKYGTQIRSMSGWTAEMFGVPDKEFLGWQDQETVTLESSR